MELAALPASPAFRNAFDGETRRVLQATGGDDYELCFTAPEAMRSDLEQAARETGIDVARIGRIVAGTGVAAQCENGEPWAPPSKGYAHFA